MRYRLCTPVVVSSEIPRHSLRYFGNLSCTKLVKSPPSSRIKFNGLPSLNNRVCSIHHIYSSSVSPFQAYTGIPAFAIAAAAWSCVLNILHEDHWTYRYNSNNGSVKSIIKGIKINMFHVSRYKSIYFIQYIDNLSFQILNFFLINHTNDK